MLDAVASSGATQVQYEITGGTLTDSVIATAAPTIYGWVALWNTTTVVNGNYTLESVASYSGGGSASSSAVTITVNNPPPTTAVLIPANNATVSGTSQVLDAVASAGATQVQFEITGGTLTDSVIATAAPTIYGWVALWNTTTVVNGNYTLDSVASYAGGVSTSSSPLTITVNNPPPSTTVLIPTSGSTVDLTQTYAVFDAVASPGVTQVTFELEVFPPGAPPALETFPASPTIYGWIGVLAGNPGPCTPKPCSYATLFAGVLSEASYSNGVMGVSQPVDVTIFVNEGVIP